MKCRMHMCDKQITVHSAQAYHVHAIEVHRGMLGTTVAISTVCVCGMT